MKTAFLFFACVVLYTRAVDEGRLIPHLAFVMLNPEGLVGFWSCSGTLIGERSVLVHSSCAVINGHTANNGFVDLGIARPWTHEIPEFSATITNVTVNDELAIVHLPEKPVLSANIQILELPTTNKTGSGFLLGWEDKPWRAHVAPVIVKSCHNQTDSGQPLLCSDSSEDICVTAGSSFVLNNKTLVAVTSDTNYRCSHPRKQHYVSIYKYVDWIKSLI